MLSLWLLTILPYLTPSDRVLARFEIPRSGHAVAAVVESSNREYPEIKTVAVIVKSKGRVVRHLQLLDGVRGAEVKVLRASRVGQPQFWIRSSGADHYVESVVGLVGREHRPTELYSYSGRAEVEIEAGRRIAIREVYSFGVADREIPKRFTDRRRSIVREFVFDRAKARYEMKRGFHYGPLAPRRSSSHKADEIRTVTTVKRSGLGQ